MPTHRLGLGKKTVPPTSTPTVGTTYYVDTQGGSDGFNGLSTDQAWATVSKVNAAIFSPGDNILFKRGQTHTTSLVCDNFGTSANRITYGSYGSGALPVFHGGGAARVRGTRTPILVTGDWNVVENVQAQFGSYEDIGITGDDVTVRACTVVGGVAGVYQKAASARALVTLNTITNVDIVIDGAGGTSDDDSGAFGVLIWGTDGEFSYNTITGCSGPSADYIWDGSAFEVFNGTGMEIHHNTVADCQAFCELGTDQSAINVNASLHNNLVTASLERAVGLNAQGAQGLFGPVNNLTLEHNTFRLTGGSGSLTGSQGFIIGTGSSGHTVRNNIFQVTWKGGYTSEAITEDHNLYFGYTQNQVKSNLSVDGLSVGPNSFTADPLFTSSTVHTLTAASPALGRGALLGYTTDLAGGAHPTAPSFSDGFEAGNLALWDTVTQEVDATFVASTLAAHAGTYGARSHVTSTVGSRSNIQKAIPSPDVVRLVGWFRVVTQGLSGTNVPTFRLFNTGQRLLDIYRQNTTGELWIRRTKPDTTLAFQTLGVTRSLNTWFKVEMHAHRTATTTVAALAWIDGVRVLNLSMDVIAGAFNRVYVGAEHTIQVGDFDVDEVEFWSGGYPDLGALERA